MWQVPTLQGVAGPAPQGPKGQPPHGFRPRGLALGCTIRKVAGSPPQNAGAVNYPKTYENAGPS